MRERGRVVVISPHFDDGVFSCGEVLAEHPGSIVITVFGGKPHPGAPLTPWDAAAGFGDGDDVVTARRAEDRRALRQLGADPVWLDFLDSQYGSSPSAEAIISALAEAVRHAGAGACYAPLGLFHSDHHLAHEAALAVMAQTADVVAFFYEDAIYRRIPGLTQERLRALRLVRPLRAHPLRRRTGARKRRAVACYRSQLRALASPGRPGVADVYAEEVYWPVDR